jgi:hypothetical protein
MRSAIRLLLVSGVLALAACGSEGASARVRVRPDAEAYVTFTGNRAYPYRVAITNEGPSPVEVLWSNRMLDATLAPGADATQTLEGESRIRIRCQVEAGAFVRLDAPDAEAVRVVGTRAPAQER